MRGVSSTKRPNCNPPCGMAQGDLLIPVVGIEVCVVGSGVEKRKEMGQARQEVVDETCCAWMTFKMRKGATHTKLEPHAGACDDL